VSFKFFVQIKVGEQKKTQLHDQVKQLSVKEKQLSEELDKAKEAISPKHKQLLTAEEEKRKAKAQHNSIREIQQRQLTSLKSRLANLKDINKTLENIESKNLTGKLEALKLTVEKLTSEKEAVITQKEKTSSKISGLEKELASQNVKFLSVICHFLLAFVSLG
jgi:chromosome segregation ATPase